MPLLILSFVVAIIFCLPSKNMDLRAQESLFPLVSVGVLLALLIFSQINRFAGAFILFLLVMCIVRFTPQSYAALTDVIIYSGLFYAVVVNYGRFKTRLDQFRNAVCVLALLNAAWVFLQYFGVYLIFILKDPLHYTGFFANRNETAIFLGITISFFFRKQWWPGVIPVIGALILLQCTNGTLTASLSIALYGGFYIRERYHNVFLPMVAGALVCVALTGVFMVAVHQGNWRDRLLANQEALKLVVEKPLMGWGVGQGQFVFSLFINAERQEEKLRNWQFSKVIYRNDLQRVYREKHTYQARFYEWWREIHNDHLQIILEMGFIGYAIFLAAMLSIAWSHFKTENRDDLIFISLTALIFSACAFFTFQIGRFVFLAVILAGMIQGAYRCRES